MTDHEKKLRKARKYLQERGIGLLNKNSKLVYRDSHGVVKTPQKEEAQVIVLDDLIQRRAEKAGR